MAEAYLDTLCSTLKSENETNPDPESKRARQTALWFIESSAKVLHQYPNVPIKRRMIPPIETLFRMRRLVSSILFYFRPRILFHLFILLYFGLLPHGAFYACKSLIKENYARFDFISTPALLKGATCIGLSYITIQRNQGILETVEGIQNGTLSRQNVSQHIYQGTIGTVYDMYRGKNLSNTLVYQDTAFVSGYVEWAVGSIWYATTHRASDSTRVFVKWLNRKTKVIVAIRDAFMELPVIKQVRAAVKAIEDTVEHHVVRPIRETVRHGVQCLIDGFSYFGKRLIQWGKTGVLKEEQGAIA